MTGLNDRQRKFAENLAVGMSQLDAYKRAGYSFKSDKVALAAASRLLTNVNLSRYLDTLRQRAAEQAVWSREQMIRFLCSVLEIDITDCIDGQTGAMNLAKAGRMVTQFKVQEKFNANGDTYGVDKDAKFFSKEKAAEMLTKMLGWNEPEKVEATHTVRVVWGDE